MLELKSITKDYPAGEDVVHALKGIDIAFRKSEFVSILGQSGCGKTTLLNIIGGLDGYTDGDLVIDGVSTKDFKDRDWDSYRNHSVGFVFQSYNLIPHQTVLQNVEIALTLSGVPKAERKALATRALEEVGLGNQLNKKPNQMSGGQMQRVAIARALVNNPEIILADEPTGALDTETSVQVMEILKEVSRDRLVVMVTHNPELAEKYSSRIIRMLDGVVVGDSDPLSDEEYAREAAACARKDTETPVVAEYSTDEQYSTVEPSDEAAAQSEGGEEKKVSDKKKRKPSMSFWTAFRLSLTNLFTKKGRTILTAFAGSIGIIGIALILAVSQGMTGYINTVQEETLSTYPITVRAEETDMTSLMQTFMDIDSGKPNHGNDAVYKKPLVFDVANAISSLQTSKNDLNSFKKYLEEETVKDGSSLSKAVVGLQYSYGLDLLTYTENPDGEILQCDANVLMRQLINKYLAADGSMNNSTAMIGGSLVTMGSSLDLWQELLPAKDGSSQINDILKNQYDVVYGSWPTAYNEIVIVLDEYNQLDDITLYVLGLLGNDMIDDVIDAVLNGKQLEVDDSKWSYQEICGKEIKVVLNSDCYDYDEESGKCTDLRENAVGLKTLYDRFATTLKISGIIKPDPKATSTMLSGTIGYTSALTKHVVNKAGESKAVKAQKENPLRDIVSGKPFKASSSTLDDSQKNAGFRAYIESVTAVSKRADIYEDTVCYLPEAIVQSSFDAQIASTPVSEIKNMVMATLAENGMSEEMIERVLAQFEQIENSGMTEEQIKAQLKPYVEDYAKDMIREQYAEAQKARLAAMTDEEKSEALKTAIEVNAAALTEAFKIEITPDALAAEYYDSVIDFSETTYEQNLIDMGCVDLDTPTAISIYASSFENKDVITRAISDYNKNVDETKRIQYTDYVGLMMSAVTTIINAITYVLVAFVAISLIVSSIMVGVITLISVQERTKEIGILRAIGASKRDVSSMFNAETIIIGFASGLFGVLVTYLLCIPINLILHALTGIGALSAFLHPVAALILIAISVLLTLISGLIPSRSAAKKDPVVALRTE